MRPTCEPRAKEVKAIYDRAVAYAGPDPSLPPAKQEAARRTQQRAFEQELWQLCVPYAHTSSPLQTLCERVERFLPELFVFVAVPGVPADNNLAERSVRPLVIARKISGGSRSPNGSQTRMALFSLFGSWAAEATQSVLPLPGCPCPVQPFRLTVNNIERKKCLTAGIWSAMIGIGVLQPESVR
jgi:transposase